MTAFEKYHPAANLLYFCVVLVFSMFFMHPACLLISLICAFCCSVKYGGRRSLRFNLIYMLPMMIFAALINPAFNHSGVTVLAYFPSGNPLTLESIAYGMAAAAMIGSVVMWCSCFMKVITTDKIVYLFGKLMPSISLMISIALGFIPRFKRQFAKISNAQKGIGHDASQGSLSMRIRQGIKIISIMITWSLESAVKTSDSMKSRGYGLEHRTSFEIFKFEKRDAMLLILICCLSVYMILGSAFNGVYWRYFPSMQGNGATAYTISVFIAYFLLCMIPLVIETIEERKWKYLRSKI